MIGAPQVSPSWEFTHVKVGHCDWWSGYFKSPRLARWRWRLHLLVRHGKWSDYMKAGYDNRSSMHEGSTDGVA